MDKYLVGSSFGERKMYCVRVAYCPNEGESAEITHAQTFIALTGSVNGAVHSAKRFFHLKHKFPTSKLFVECIARVS